VYLDTACKGIGILTKGNNQGRQEVKEVFFDGLMTQSEINCLLDEIFGDLDEASLDEAEGAGLTLYEERERENTDHTVLLTA
jgi:hypothetical protein